MLIALNCIIIVYPCRGDAILVEYYWLMHMHALDDGVIPVLSHCHPHGVVDQVQVVSIPSTYELLHTKTMI